jgi:putative phosphoribosyl transferase
MIPGRTTERNGGECEVSIGLGKVTLQATLALPENPKGFVLFAHGSGSSRHSPRNRYVAAELQSHGMATLLFDLLTSDEEAIDERTMQLRFNINLLAKRLVGATRWVVRNPGVGGLNIGYFGASTGAAAALVAAAQIPDSIAAIVSRGGRPDLAGEALSSVQAPTLLIVGGNDELVVKLNQQALAELRCQDKKLAIVPGATHLFEEPGALENVAAIAAEWFAGHFAPVGQGRVRQTASQTLESFRQQNLKW